ncbi:MAG: hypothetical protein RLN60_04010 [Phycisphaerales bacterium]
MSSHSFYEILGAPRDASKELIDRAFAERVEEFGGFDEVPESVHTAYMVLKSASIRPFYDWFLEQAEGGTPVECDDEERAQVEEYCKRWGYELVPHPDGPSGSWLIKRRTSRPPKIPKPTPDGPTQRPSDGDSRAEAPNRSRSQQEPDRDTVPWPPPPLALGNRFFHWILNTGRVLDVFRANEYGQFQVQIDGEPDIKVWKAVELRETNTMPGDQIKIVSLCERAVTNRNTYISLINFTRGGVTPLFFLVNKWKREIRYYDRPHHFGVRNQRAADQLLEQYFYAMAYQSWRIAGATEADARSIGQENARYATRVQTRDWKQNWQQG